MDTPPSAFKTQSQLQKLIEILDEEMHDVDAVAGGGGGGAAAAAAAADEQKPVTAPYNWEVVVISSSDSPSPMTTTRVAAVVPMSPQQLGNQVLQVNKSAQIFSNISQRSPGLLFRMQQQQQQQSLQPPLRPIATTLHQPFVFPTLVPITRLPTDATTVYYPISQPHVTAIGSAGPLSASSPGVRALPKRLREDLEAQNRVLNQELRSRYAASLEKRTRFVEMTVRISRYGDPLDEDDFGVPSGDPALDPFVRVARLVRSLYLPPGYIETFANNIPYWVTDAQLDALAKLYSLRLSPLNHGELVRGLLMIDYDRAFDPEETKRLVDAPNQLVGLFNHPRAVNIFLAEDKPYNTLAFLATIQLFPFVAPLNDDSRAFGQVRAACADALAVRLTKKKLDQVFVSIYRQTLVKTFFTMKQFQSVEHLKRDAFSFSAARGACPLFRKYSHLRVLSKGAAGFVMSMVPRESHNPNVVPELPAVTSIVEGAPEPEVLLLNRAPQFAVKIQAVEPPGLDLRKGLVDTNDTAYCELVTMYTVNQRASHWDASRRASNLYNHVRVDDWVRCRFNPSTEITPLLKRDDRENIKKHLPDREAEWQIIVMELADMGDMASTMTKGSLKAVEEFCTWESFAAIAVQILGHIQSLRRWHYTHHDVKPLNILLCGVAPSQPVRYFVYKNVGLGGGEETTLYVPVWGNGIVAKLADQGFACIDGSAHTSDGRVITVFIPSKKERKRYGHTYNPAVDLELFCVNFIATMLTAFQTWNVKLDEVHIHVDAMTLSWLKAHYRQNPQAHKGTEQYRPEVERLYDYIGLYLDLMIALLTGDAPNNTPEAAGFTYKGLIQVSNDIYLKISPEWRGMRPVGYEDCIARALSWDGFTPMRTPPPSGTYTFANKALLDMTAYMK